MLINFGRALLALTLVLFAVTASAQNKVVVVPLAGDDLKPLANIVTVATANGDFSDPIAAMASINAEVSYMLLIELILIDIYSVHDRC